MIKMKDYETIIGQEIDLIQYEKNQGDLEKGFVPEYKFHILLHGTNERIGHIHLRLGHTEKVIKYIGHIGYGIEPSHRGNRYAAKACQLIKRVARDFAYKKLVITCNPDNYASRRTCEGIGADLIEIIDIPESSDAYSFSEVQKCRYEWCL